MPRTAPLSPALGLRLGRPAKTSRLVLGGVFCGLLMANVLVTRMPGAPELAPNWGIGVCVEGVLMCAVLRGSHAGWYVLGALCIGSVSLELSPAIDGAAALTTAVLLSATLWAAQVLVLVQRSLRPWRRIDLVVHDLALETRQTRLSATPRDR
jgi:hypothetical protein